VGVSFVFELVNPLGNVMKTLAVYEVKASLSYLLNQVEAGEVIKITRRGVAIARIVPEHPPVKVDVSALIAKIKNTRTNYTLDDLDWRELTAEGRD
jgi:prevent-host-death family protein